MRTFFKVFLLVICFFSLSILFSCSKSLEGKLVEGQVALTFDDSSIDNWFDYLPLLDSLNIKATFYVSRYHTLTSMQKRRLHTIEQQGHEIAYHTANHPNMVNTVEKDGVIKTIADEIDTDLNLMRHDGFTIDNFAYPYGRHNQTLDIALLRTFKSIRAVSNKQNYEKSLAKHSGERQLFYGACIDMCSRLTEGVLINLLEQARTYHDCLVLMAHQINNPNLKYQVTTDRLRKLANEANHKNLQFVTIRNITY